MKESALVFYGHVFRFPCSEKSRARRKQTAIQWMAVPPSGHARKARPGLPAQQGRGAPQGLIQSFIKGR
ncbi:MAG: hypothetical protein A2150_01720 [Candidatus Muproteobacteria bacterium RBG_16_64_11]|uniref:Uncharacterized protein n=1 Tax=Candidatus Muproteobacteria bacterium RBG_16_64_11 TaxID=1817758 RepID=A0A1F6TIR3_9PROT|nr:MAG: hypothetical protein A2150_01720 [Candidatus Muproteobacteria bacterium RBG_16_64_11]